MRPPGRSGPHEHQRTKRASIDQLPRFLQGRVIAVIESDSAPAIVALRGSDQPIDLCNGTRRRLLDEHMLPGLDGGRPPQASRASLVVATMTTPTSG